MNSESNSTTTSTIKNIVIKQQTSSEKYEMNVDTQETIKAFRELCQLLDISEQLVCLSIKDYNAVKSCFILQGDQKLWLVCALYGLVLSISNGGLSGAAISAADPSNQPMKPNYIMRDASILNRKPNVPNYTNSGCGFTASNFGAKIPYPTSTSSTTPSVSITTATQLSDNSDSLAFLSKLLRLVKINVNFFFSKFNNWMRMIDLPKHVTQLISSIEISEGVSCAMFQKYMQLFCVFFRTPEVYCLIDLKSNKRKSRKRLCDLNELFHFGWMLFVATKELVSIVYDVSSGFHLLLHCLKFTFINVVHENDLASKVLAVSVADDERCKFLKNCSLEALEGVFFEVLDAHGFIYTRKESELTYRYIFYPALQFIQNQNHFVFNLAAFKSALDCDNITPNLKYLIELYRDYRILHFGLDETEYVKLLYNDKSTFVPLVLNNQTVSNTDGSLSGVPVASPDHTVVPIDYDPSEKQYKDTKMKQNLLHANNTSQDELSLSVSPEHYALNLMIMLKKLMYNADGSNFKDSLDNLLKANSFHVALRKATSLPESALEVFLKAINDENLQSNVESWNICVDMYYKLLYTTVESEISKIPNSEGLQNIMSFISSHDFHKSLLTVCFDIFVFVNDLPKPFPWICKLFDIEPFYLIQCIELIIKYEPKLPRAVTKHLTILEEDIVSCHGWSPTSPIYARLDAQVNGTDGTINDNSSTMIEENLDSRLPFFCNVKIDGVFEYDESLITMTEPLFDKNDTSIGGGVYTDPNITPNKFCGVEVCYYSRRSSNRLISSTVSIFYQKVYHIVLTRLNDFGIKLKLTRGQKSLIWKCMEYMLVFHTYLMKDHHLDQLLICSIYTVMKVINRSVSFSRILQHHESQPQAKLSLSRKVSSSIITTLLHNSSLSISFNVSLDNNSVKAFISASNIRISNTTPGNNANDNENSLSSVLPIGASITYMVSDETRSRLLEFFTPKQLVAMSDETCDIIQFYNKIFSHVVQRFANEMAQFFIQKKIFVEPYPILKTESIVSPLRISSNYAVFVSPMKTVSAPNHFNLDQPATPFFNNKMRSHNLGNSSVRFNLASDKSPLVCREINRFVSETKRDTDFMSFSTSTNPVRRRLIIEDEDTRKIAKIGGISNMDPIK